MFAPLKTRVYELYCFHFFSVVLLFFFFFFPTIYSMLSPWKSSILHEDPVYLRIDYAAQNVFKLQAHELSCSSGAQRDHAWYLFGCPFWIQLQKTARSGRRFRTAQPDRTSVSIRMCVLNSSEEFREFVLSAWVVCCCFFFLVLSYHPSFTPFFLVAFKTKRLLYRSVFIKWLSAHPLTQTPPERSVLSALQPAPPVGPVIKPRNVDMLLKPSLNTPD